MENGSQLAPSTKSLEKIFLILINTSLMHSCLQRQVTKTCSTNYMYSMVRICFVQKRSGPKRLKTSWQQQSRTQIAKFMEPAWAPPVSFRPQMGPMLFPWTLLSGKMLFWFHSVVLQISCGAAHNLCLQESELLLGWGENMHGEICVGNSEDISAPATIRVDGKKWVCM